MRNILKFFAVSFAALSLSACSDAGMSEKFDQGENLHAVFPNENPVLEGEADASHQWEANEKLAKLLASFGSELAPENHERPKYPEYYGGAYIIEEGGLVIYIYGDAEKGKRAVKSVIGEDNIEFKEAGFSYAYLTLLMDEFNAFAIAGKDPKIMEMLSGFSLMDMTNDVEVQVVGLDEGKREILEKSIFSRPGVRFERSEGKVELEATIYPGCEFARNSSMTRVSSVGFRAKRDSDGKMGFVTTGHSISVGTTAYYAGIPVGTCVNSQQSGTVDAAFVTLNNPTSDNVHNKLCSMPHFLSTSTAFPNVGTIVHKVGRSTGYTSGAVICTNATVSSVNVITNLTRTEYISAKGDSGGTVYAYLNSNGIGAIAGVHLGSANSSGYYTKTSNILIAFGLSKY